MGTVLGRLTSNGRARNVRLGAVGSDKQTILPQQKADLDMRTKWRAERMGDSVRLAKYY